MILAVAGCHRNAIRCENTAAKRCRKANERQPTRGGMLEAQSSKARGPRQLAGVRNGHVFETLSGMVRSGLPERSRYLDYCQSVERRD